MQTDIITQAKLIANKLNGVKRVNLLGRNTAISNATETVWNAGGTYAQLTAAVAFEILSADANDTAAGTGARTVELDLVNGSHVETTVTAILNGTSAVAIPGTFLACNGARVLTSGSGLVNAGVITVRVASAGATQRQIATGTGSNGRDTDFIYTVPANKLAIISDVKWGASGVTGSILVSLDKQDTAGNRQTITSANRGIEFTAINAATGTLGCGMGMLIPEKTLMQLKTVVSTGVGDLVASGFLTVITLNSAANPSGNAWQI